MQASHQAHPEILLILNTKYLSLSLIAEPSQNLFCILVGRKDGVKGFGDETVLDDKRDSLVELHS